MLSVAGEWEKSRISIETLDRAVRTDLGRLVEVTDRDGLENGTSRIWKLYRCSPLASYSLISLL